MLTSCMSVKWRCIQNQVNVKCFLQLCGQVISALFFCYFFKILFYSCSIFLFYISVQHFSSIFLFYIFVLYFCSIFLFYIFVLYFCSTFLFYVFVLYFCSIFLFYVFFYIIVLFLLYFIQFCAIFFSERNVLSASATNIAMGKAVFQGDDHPSGKWGPLKAIDGNTDSNLYNDHCSFAIRGSLSFKYRFKILTIKLFPLSFFLFE